MPGDPAFPDALPDGTDGAGRPAAVILRASSGSTSARSSVPAASAAARFSRGTAVSTTLSSLAGAPHHFGSRARVRVPACSSRPCTANGPAVSFSSSRAPSLKARASPITLFGYSGVNSDFQSAYGLAKVTLTSRALPPCSTFSIRS